MNSLEKLKQIVDLHDTRVMLETGYPDAYVHKLSEDIENSLKALEIIKECFDMNGLGELIPNENWWKDTTNRELLCKEVYQGMHPHLHI